MRKIFFWLHLAAGSGAAVVILIMSLTGVLLTYQRQMTACRARIVPGAARLPVETLLAGVAGRPSTFTMRADPAAPAEVAFGRERAIYLNPYTGAIVGESSAPMRAFFHQVEDWHRWLGAEGSERPAARAVTGACNLAFLFLAASGVYLWWPGSLRWPRIRAITLFRGGLSGRARDFNWHNVIGFWCALPLVAVTLTAVVISYPWASQLLYRVAGGDPREALRGRPSGGPGGAAPQLAGLNPLWERAERQVPGWRSITLRLGNGPAAFTIDEGDGGRPDLRSQLLLDRRSGRVIRWEPFSSYSAGRRLRTWFRFIHTGEAGGWVGQTVAGVASLGGVVLVWTGISLALRRLARAVRRRRREIDTEPVAEREEVL